MIKIENVSKYYVVGKDKKNQIYDGINLELPSVGFFSLNGSSGSGKTTLFNLIGGIDHEFQGNIQSFGYNLSDCNLNSYRKNVVGFIYQDFNLIDNLTVNENLNLVLINDGRNNIEKSAAVNEVLQQVNLVEMGNRYPNQLSGGEIQRIAIARALLRDVKVILADEPTGNLDYDNARDILDTMKKISKNKLVIMVSHDKVLSREYSDDIVLIDDLNEEKIIVKGKRVDFSEVSDIEGKILSKFDFLYPWILIKNNRISTAILTLLLSVLLIITFSSYKVTTIAEKDIVSEYVLNSDSLTYEVIGTEFSEIATGDIALDQKNTMYNIYDSHEIFSDAASQFDNLILTNRILFSYLDEDGFHRPLRNNIGLLDGDTDYDLKLSKGRIPEEPFEIVITDYLAMIFFGTEDVLGEELIGNITQRYDIVFTIVGIQKTSYVEDEVTFDYSDLIDQYFYSVTTSGENSYSYDESKKYVQSYTLIDTFKINNTYRIMSENGYLNIKCDVCEMNYRLPVSYTQINMDRVIGNIPDNENQIIFREDLLKEIIPQHESDIDDLIQGVIDWDQFVQIVELPTFGLDIADDRGDEFWRDKLPETYEIVGIYEMNDDSLNILCTSTELMELINENFPYYRIGLLYLDTDNNFNEVYDELTKDVYLGAYGVYGSDSRMVFNSNGSYNVYKSLETFINDTKATYLGVYIGGLVIVSLFLILNSSLVLKQKSKNNGILLSLGMSRKKIVFMTVMEMIYLIVLPFILATLFVYMSSNYLSLMIFADVNTFSIVSYNHLDIIMFGLIALVFLITSVVIPIVYTLGKSPIQLIRHQ